MSETQPHHPLLGDPKPVPRDGGGFKLAFDIEDITALQSRISAYFKENQSAKAEGGKE